MFGCTKSQRSTSSDMLVVQGFCCSVVRETLMFLENGKRPLEGVMRQAEKFMTKENRQNAPKPFFGPAVDEAYEATLRAYDKPIPHKGDFENLKRSTDPDEERRSAFVIKDFFATMREKAHGSMA